MSDNIFKAETLDDLHSVLDENEKVVVVFSAVDWCIPCQRLAPHVVAAANQLPDVTFVDVDIDHVEGAKEEFEIMGVPKVYAFMDGDLFKELKGRTSLQLIAELK